MRDIPVSVTAAHIADARRGSCTHCPLALALTEATGHQCYVTTGWLQWPGRMIVSQSGWMKDIMGCYDRGEAMEPFGFTLTGTGGIYRIQAGNSWEGR